MAHTAQDPASGRLTASSTTAQMQTPEMMDESRKGTGSTAISMQAKAQSWEGTCSDDSVGLIGKESLPTLKQSTQKTSILHWLQLQLKLWGKQTNKNKNRTQKSKVSVTLQSFFCFCIKGISTFRSTGYLQAGHGGISHEKSITE